MKKVRIVLLLTAVFTLAGFAVLGSYEAFADPGDEWVTPSSIAACCGAESSGPCSKMIDGGIYSEWRHYQDELHYIDFDLGVQKTVKKIRFFSAGAGVFKWLSFDAYVSADGSSWGAPVGTGLSLTAFLSWQEIDITDKDGRYIKIDNIVTDSSPNWLKGTEFQAYVYSAPVNQDPTCSAINGPSSVEANSENTYTATASDGDSDPISYTWSADCGTFPYGNTGNSVTWRAPGSAGSCVISCDVFDGQGGSGSCPSKAVSVSVPIYVPTVTTQAASSIGETTATGNGAITDTGGENCTARGFKYGLTETDTWSVSESGSFGTGIYTKGLTGLSSGTTYYIRAYATNSVGTSYGSWISFTTSSAPTYTPEKTMIDDSSGSGGGAVSAGGDIISPNPDTDPQAVSWNRWILEGYDDVDFPSYLELQTMYDYTNALSVPPGGPKNIISPGIYVWDSCSDCQLNPPPCGAEDAVIFVDGNLTINATFFTPPIEDSDNPLDFKNLCDSSLAFIVKDNINIQKNINNIYGIFYAEGTINTSSDGESSNRLYVFGSLLAGGFTLSRNLGADNTTYPAEQIIYMPQYLLTLKNLLGRSQYTWREVK